MSQAITSTPRKTIEEVYPNIYLIYGQNRSAHSYLIKGTTKNVLIDSCLPNGVDSVVSRLATIGITPDDLDFILLTHEHIDHAGGVPQLTHNAIVGAHRLAANKLTLRDEFVLMSGAFGGLNDAPFHIDLLLTAGFIVDLGNYELHVIHTPVIMMACRIDLWQFLSTITISPGATVECHTILLEVDVPLVTKNK